MRRCASHAPVLSVPSSVQSRKPGMIKDNWWTKCVRREEGNLCTVSDGSVLGNETNSMIFPIHPVDDRLLADYSLPLLVLAKLAYPETTKTIQHLGEMETNLWARVSGRDQREMRKVKLSTDAVRTDASEWRSSRDEIKTTEEEAIFRIHSGTTTK